MLFLQYKFLKKDGDPNVKIEGKDTEDWMCIDFGKQILKVFSFVKIQWYFLLMPQGSSDTLTSIAMK